MLSFYTLSRPFLNGRVPHTEYWGLFHKNNLQTNFCVTIELFSIESRETKTKAITMANHNKFKQQNEPMRTRTKYT